MQIIDAVARKSGLEGKWMVHECHQPRFQATQSRKRNSTKRKAIDHDERVRIDLGENLRGVRKRLFGRRGEFAGQLQILHAPAKRGQFLDHALIVAIASGRRIRSPGMAKMTSRIRSSRIKSWRIKSWRINQTAASYQPRATWDSCMVTRILETPSESAPSLPALSAAFI